MPFTLNKYVHSDAASNITLNQAELIAASLEKLRLPRPYIIIGLPGLSDVLSLEDWAINNGPKDIPVLVTFVFNQGFTQPLKAAEFAQFFTYPKIFPNRNFMIFKQITNYLAEKFQNRFISDSELFSLYISTYFEAGHAALAVINQIELPL